MCRYLNHIVGKMARRRLSESFSTQSRVMTIYEAEAVITRQKHRKERTTLFLNNNEGDRGKEQYVMINENL